MSNATRLVGRFSVLSLVVAAVALWGGSGAWGAILTWDANGAAALQTDGAGAWLTANQWWDGSTNVSWTSGDDAIFGNGGAGGAVTLASPTTVNSLTMNRFSGTYTLGTAGQTMTLNNGITVNSSAGTVSIISPITLGAAQTWLNNGGNNFTVGTGAVNNGGFLLTVGGIANYSGTTISSAIGGAGGLTKNGAGTLILSGANTYGGVTTVNAGQITVNGANGVINTSSGITLSGGKLLLDNSINNNANRIKDTGDVTLSLGGELNLTGSTTGTTESFGTLGIAAGNSTVTVKEGTAAQIATLAGSAFSRTANGTALFRGTSLGQNATQMGKVTLTDSSALTFVGASTLNNAANGDTTKDVKIVPYLIGGSTDTDAGSTFITYDSTLGFRALSTTNQFDTALTAGNNVRLTANTTASSSVAINSLIIANTSATALTINDGQTLTVSSGAVLFPNAATIKPSTSTGILDFGSAEGVVTVNSGLIGTISAVVNGSGGLTKAGTGTLVLSGSNGYTGNTTVNAGTLTATKAAALNSSTVVFNGGTLGVQVGGSGWTTGQVDTLLSGATKTAGALGIDTANGSLTQWTAFTPSNLGVLGLTKLGASTLTLDQANTFTGPVTVRAGTLTLSHANAIASSSGLVLNGGAAVLTTGVTLNSLTYADNLAASSVSGGTLNFNPGGTITTGLNISRTINVGITGAPSVTYDCQSGGALTFQPTGSATMTLGNILNVHVTSANGVLVLDGSTTGNSIGDFTTSSGGNAGQVSQLVKNGIGTWTVGNVNKFTTATPSTTTINAGTLIVPSTGSLYGGAAVYGGTLQYNWRGAIGSGSFTIGTTILAVPAQLDNASGAPITDSAINPAMAWNGNWTFIGSQGANSDLNLGTGAVTLNNNALTGNPVVTIQNAATTLTVGGSIGGAGIGLIKAGPGTLKLTGSSGTYSGPTAVSAGTLKLSNNSALAGSALDTTGAGFVTLDTGITTPTFGGLKASGTSRDLATVISSGYNLVTTLTLNPGAGVTVTYGGAIADGALNMNLTKSGAGTQILSGTNTYGGTTTVSAGTLVASTPSSLPNYGTAGKVVLSGTGTLQIPVDGTVWTMADIDTLWSNATTTSGALGLDIATGTQTQAGGYAYGGGIGLTKVGAGTLELNLANTYTGATTIYGGTLLLNGANGSIANSTSVVVGPAAGTTGTLTLDSSSANNSDRVGSVGVTFNNGTLNFIGNASAATTETIGTITAAKGDNLIALSGGAVAQVATLTSTAGAVTRTAGATLTIAADGTSQQFKFTGGSAGINKGVFYGATAATANDFAYYPGGGLAVVAPTYDSSGNFATPATTLTASKHNKLSGDDASDGGVSIYSLNMPSNYSITALTGNLTFTSATDQGAIIKSGGGAAQIGTAGDAFDIVGQTGGELVINTVAATDNLTLNVGITATSTALTKTGAGTLTLTANRDYLYTGATYVNAGTLVLNSLTSATAGGFRSNITVNNGGTAQLGASNKIIDTAGFTVNAGGTFDLAGFSETIGSLNGAGSVANTGGAATLTLTGANTSTFSGVISGGANTALLITGGATLILSGQNTYTGVSQVGLNGVGGTLKLGANNAINSGNTIYVGGSASGSAQTSIFDLAGYDQTAGPMTMAVGYQSPNYALVYNSVGSSKLTLTGGASAMTTYPRGAGTDNSYYIYVTTLDLNNATQTFTVGKGNNVVYDLTVSSVIQNGALTKAGTGVMLLTGANTYAGATTISNGTLSINTIADWAASPTATAVGAPTTLADGTIAIGSLTTTGRLLYTGGAQNTNRPISLAGTTGGATLDQSGTGLLRFTDTSIIASGAGAKTLTLQGSTAGTGQLDGIVADNSPTFITSVTKAGTGAWTLTGANTYTGVTTISGGTLSISSIDVVANANPLGKSTAAASNLKLGNGTTLKYTGGAASCDRAFTINGTAAGDSATLDASGTGALNLTSTTSPAYGTAAQTRTLILSGTNTGANTLAANIGNNTTAAVSLTKNGVGTWVLSGTNTYTGLTTVKAGTLQLGVNAQAPVLTGANGADIQGGKMVLEYTGTAPDVRPLLQASYNPAAPWTAGQFHSSTADASHGLGWEIVSGQTKIAYTFYGDATLDGSVDSSDLAKVLANYNQSTGMVWGQGDFNYDDAVDSTDLAKVLANYNQTLPTSIIVGNFWAPTASGGDGPWSAAGLNWATAASTLGDKVQATSGSLPLKFTGTAGTVTVGGTVTVPAGLSFETDGYIVTPGASAAISLAGANAAANTITVGGTALLPMTATIGVNLTGTAGMTKAGLGTLKLTVAPAYTGGTVIAAGTLELAPPVSVTLNYADAISGGGTLVKSDAGTVYLTGSVGSQLTVKAGTLKLGTSAQGFLTGTPCDIQGGKMVLEGGPAVQTLLAASYNPAAPWIAGQFHSSTADASHGLGWEIVSGQTKIAYTFYGDATLDGSVDSSDLAKVLANYNQTTGMVWGQGDFNYDTAVDSTDLAKVLANYNQTLPSGISITATSYGHLDAQAIQMLTAAGFTVVPEPSTLVLLAAGLVALAGWMIRRRK